MLSGDETTSNSAGYPVWAYGGCAVGVQSGQGVFITDELKMLYILTYADYNPQIFIVHEVMG